MGLTDEIAAAGLTPSLVRAFLQGLYRVASADGMVDGVEREAMRALTGLEPEESTEPIPLDLLWAHSEIFIRACVYLALLDGQYGVEEARVVSHLAHRLGVSAYRLAELEEAVFVEIRASISSR